MNDVYKEQDAKYRADILENLSILESRVFKGTEYPSLCKMLSKGAGCRRLTALLLYFWQYGNSEPLSEEQKFILSMSEEYTSAMDKEKEANSISHNSQRGNEICFPVYRMAAVLCQDKPSWDDKSWKRYVYLFMSLGLVKRYLPDQHEPWENTPLQNISLEAAGWVKNAKGVYVKPKNKDIKRASTWYHVPNYSTNGYFILRRAEDRAKLFQQYRVSVSNIHKDSVRDVLGDTVANSIFDTTNKQPWEPVQKMRSVFEDVLEKQLAEAGWTTEAKVLKAVYEHYQVYQHGELFEDEEDRSKKHAELSIKKNWSKFKPELRRRGIKAVPPTAEDRERWGLPDRRWIFKKPESRAD